MDKPALLEIKRLNIWFGAGENAFHAARDVSLTILAGETLGVVGESGSGKSVTALSVLRLLPEPPARLDGEILLRKGPEQPAADLLKLPRKQLRYWRGRGAAMIFQEPMTALNPVLRCGEQVKEALKLHQPASETAMRARVLELFDEARLPRREQLYKSYPHEISGGQKQRVMIAMALACNPALLIADEPTTALDVTVQKAILDLLAELRQSRGLSMLFISHDLGVVAQVADRVAVMYKGEIVEEGAAAETLRAPIRPYTKALAACRPPLARKLARLPTLKDYWREEDAQVSGANEEAAPREPEIRVVPPDEQLARARELAEKPPLLSVRGLKVWFPARKGWFARGKEYVKAVDDVDFDIYPGETLGLVGESGCGKTTLGRALLRLVEPTAGVIQFGGEDLAKVGGARLRKLRKEIQIVFQDPFGSLNPRMKIGPAIMEPMAVHNVGRDAAERRDRAIGLLERVELGENHFGRYPGELSGGQRQRVVIARALACEPRFVVCDESVSALDVSVQARTLNLLKDLQEDFNLTYLFISHDFSVIRFLADRAMVMRAGAIVEQGPTETVLNQPRRDYTKALLASIPDAENPAAGAAF